MEVSGRRVRRFRLRFGGAEGREDGGASVLPVSSCNRRHERTGCSVSCCYCDFKIYALSEPLIRIGRRYGVFLQAWFSAGIGFGIACLILVFVVLLSQFRPCSLSDRFTAAIFGLSLSTNLSLAGFAFLFVSTVISILIHEIGHALAAASEGVQLEYIAVFVAGLFPGALVAFDYDVLQALPRSNALRVYCAGIWHNAVFCGACAMMLFLLPLILSPFYVHGETLRVLDVPSTSPLYGYLSVGDDVVSMDGLHVHSPKEWLEVAAVLGNYAPQGSNNSSNLQISRNHSKGYCVPNSVIEESYRLRREETSQLVCPGQLTAFVPIRCLESSISDDADVKDHQPIVKDNVFCLNAREVVKLDKCGDGLVTFSSDIKSCMCSQGESCLGAVQTPGMTWTEIRFLKSSSLACLKSGMTSKEYNSSKPQDNDCEQSFVFVGDLISMAHSVGLTAYQPRWTFSLGGSLPNLLEWSLACTFNVSLTLVLLNSLPVYFLDGESILEVLIGHFSLLSPRWKKKALQVCLIGGSILTLSAFLRIFFVSFSR